MCEQADPLNVLKTIGGRVASLEILTAPGSRERAILRDAARGIEVDVKWCVEQIRMEREEQKAREQ
jgi:hypothetical protein